MKLAKYVKFREEKFGAVLFETRSEKVFTLNPTATAVVREIVERHRTGAENHAERLWALVNFEMWLRRFIDGETAPDTTPELAELVGTV